MTGRRLMRHQINLHFQRHNQYRIPHLTNKIKSHWPSFLYLVLSKENLKIVPILMLI